MGEKNSQKRDGFFCFLFCFFFFLIFVIILFSTPFGYSSFDKYNWNDVDLSFLKTKNDYDSLTWAEGFAKDCLDSSTNYPSTSNMTSNGHPRHHVDSEESLDDLIQKFEDGFEITPSPLWISHQNKDLSKNKGKNKYRKTGFLNQDDQTNTFEEIMQLDCAREALNQLNSFAEQVSLKVSADILMKNKTVPMVVCVKGFREEPQKAKSFVMILGHFADRSQREAGKVHVTSFYPQVEGLKAGKEFELKVLDWGNIPRKLITFLIELIRSMVKLSKFKNSVNITFSPTYAQVLKMV